MLLKETVDLFDSRRPDEMMPRFVKEKRKKKKCSDCWVAKGRIRWMESGDVCEGTYDR